MADKKEPEKARTGAVVRVTDMPEELKAEAVTVACKAIDKFSNERGTAAL